MSEKRVAELEAQLRTSSEAWQKSCAEMHRRAQKAEGTIDRLRSELANARNAASSRSRTRALMASSVGKTASNAPSLPFGR